MRLLLSFVFEYVLPALELAVVCGLLLLAWLLVDDGLPRLLHLVIYGY